MADEYEFYVQASVRGYHAYFVDATVYIGEVMDCEMEPENDHDRYAVAVRNKDEKIAGHVPESNYPRFVIRYCHSMPHQLFFM